MLALSGFGVSGAVAHVGFTESGREALYTAARSVLNSARTRLDELTRVAASWTASDAAAPAVTDATRLERLRQRVTLALGAGFPLLPRFELAKGNEVARAFEQSDVLLGGDPARGFAWLQQVAKVRAPAHGLEDALALSEWLTDSTPSRPVVGQLPSIEGEAWIARHAPADPSAGRLGLMAFDHAGGLDALAAGTPLSGLLIDSFTERIAASEQVTGVAVHFDAPSSRAPQALLLLVVPEGESWSFDLVRDSLLETFELAKLRAVDPDILQGYGHQMPAIFGAGSIDAGPQPEVA
jgi:hypothetical protein